MRDDGEKVEKSLQNYFTWLSLLQKQLVVSVGCLARVNKR